MEAKKVIVAFTGKKGHGKDTAAKALDDHQVIKNLVAPDYWYRVNFADPLKAACDKVFGLTWKEMNVPELKERRLDRWPHESPRFIMQQVGTDLFRNQWPDVWIKAWERNILRHNYNYVTDLRFLNEAEVVRKYWGKIVRIVDPRKESTDTHKSETEMDKITSDFLIVNDGSIEDLYRKVRELDL